MKADCKKTCADYTFNKFEVLPNKHKNFMIELMVKLFNIIINLNLYKSTKGSMWMGFGTTNTINNLFCITSFWQKKGMGRHLHLALR